MAVLFFLFFAARIRHAIAFHRDNTNYALKFGATIVTVVRNVICGTFFTCVLPIIHLTSFAFFSLALSLFHNKCRNLASRAEKNTLCVH